MSGEHGASDGTLAGELCLLAVGYIEERERHLTGHRGRTAVFQDHRQEQDWEGIKVPSGLPRLEPVGPFTPPPHSQNKGLSEDSHQGRQGKLGLGNPEAYM